MKKPQSRIEWINFVEGYVLDTLALAWYTCERRAGWTDQQLRAECYQIENETFDQAMRLRPPKPDTAEQTLAQILKLIQVRAS